MVYKMNELDGFQIMSVVSGLRFHLKNHDDIDLGPLFLTQA